LKELEPPPPLLLDAVIDDDDDDDTCSPVNASNTDRAND
jgi:hypothetical protein